MLDAPPVAARVLIIEDDPNVADVVARYLRREGFRVQAVADGREGLDAALAELPDLVVLDLMLPSLGGLEICRQLRSVAPVAVGPRVLGRTASRSWLPVRRATRGKSCPWA